MCTSTFGQGDASHRHSLTKLRKDGDFTLDQTTDHAESPCAEGEALDLHQYRAKLQFITSPLTSNPRQPQQDWIRERVKN